MTWLEIPWIYFQPTLQFSSFEGEYPQDRSVVLQPHCKEFDGLSIKLFLNSQLSQH